MMHAEELIFMRDRQSQGEKSAGTLPGTGMIVRFSQVILKTKELQQLWHPRKHAQH